MSHPDTIAILTRHDLSGLSSSRGRGRQELAAIPDVTDQLLAIARAGDCDTDLRFRAFESYFALSGAAAATPGDSDALAQVYAATIAAQAYANRWGLPASVKSSATSRRLIAAGPAAKRELAPLLDDTHGMPYEGSEEATIAAEHHLRVKDLAGALIAAIVGASFPDDPDPAARDAVITALRAKL